MIDITSDVGRLAGIVILAGGASTRMGTPKAKLRLPSRERLLDYHVRHAQALSTDHLNVPIMIADNGRGFDADLALSNGNSQTSIVHITDYDNVDNKDQNNDVKIKTGGALVAIESALKALVTINSHDKKDNMDALWLLVISCDSLISATDLWQTLQGSIHQNSTDQLTDKQVICLTDEHHLYPLLGLYQLNIEPDLKAYIDNGQRRVIPFITPIAQPVPRAKEWQYLTNFNTPKEFEHACAALEQL